MIKQKLINGCLPLLLTSTSHSSTAPSSFSLLYSVPLLKPSQPFCLTFSFYLFFFASFPSPLFLLCRFWGVSALGPRVPTGALLSERLSGSSQQSGLGAVPAFPCQWGQEQLCCQPCCSLNSLLGIPWPVSRHPWSPRPLFFFLRHKSSSLSFHLGLTFPCGQASSIYSDF